MSDGGRNIILCFDGTNNRYVGASNTNVIKMMSLLLRGDDAKQLFYYQPGIGVAVRPTGLSRLKSWLTLLIDGAIAWYLPEHVLGGYRYLQRFYKPNDKIYLLGYSRGAYTARALAGMMHSVGLLERGNEELLQSAWHTYRFERNHAVRNGFRKTFSRRVEIEFLGLFDTVSAFGWAWSPRHLPFTAVNPSVKQVRHIVAMDEVRAKFAENLYGGMGFVGDSIGSSSVKQIYAAGCHGDIGGGYPEAEAGASRVALKWMLGEASACGLQLNEPAVQAALCGVNDPTPPMLHESLRGVWKLMEYVPLPWRKRRADGTFVTRWSMHLGRRRRMPAGAMVHHSVLDRVEKGAYDATLLPENPVWVYDQNICGCAAADPLVLPPVAEQEPVAPAERRAA